MYKQKILQIGYGNMGQVWSNVLSNSKLAKIVGVVEPDTSLHSKINDTLNCNVYKKIEDVDKRFSYDLILDVSPPINRLKNISFAFSKQKNILCEKPLGFNKNELMLIMDVANKNPDLVIFVNQNYRWFPWVDIVRSMINDKYKKGITLDFVTCNFLDKYIPTGYRLKEKHLYFYDMAIHHIDLFSYITNDVLVKIYVHDSNISNNGAALGASFLGLSMKNISFSYSGCWETKISTENWFFVFSDGESIKFENGILFKNDNTVLVPTLEIDRLLISFNNFLERIKNKDSSGMCSPKEIEKIIFPMIDAKFI